MSTTPYELANKALTVSEQTTGKQLTQYTSSFIEVTSSFAHAFQEKKSWPVWAENVFSARPKTNRTGLRFGSPHVSGNNISLMASASKSNTALFTAAPMKSLIYNTTRFADVWNQSQTTLDAWIKSITNPNVNEANETSESFNELELGASSSVSKQIEIAVAVNLYMPPIIFIFGIVGNILSLLVCAKKKNRNISAYYYMGVVALIDTIVLSALLSTDWIFFNFLVEVNSAELCKLFLCLDAILTDYSCWIIVAMTVDRFVAVKFPLKSHSYTNVKRAVLISIILAIFAIVKNLHLIWTAVLRYDANLQSMMCMYHSESEIFMDIYPWIDISLVSIIPSTIILSLNVTIVSGYRRSSRFQSTCSGKSFRQRPSMRLKKRHNTAVVRQWQLTGMLVLVSIVFVFLTLPRKIHVITYHLISDAHGTNRSTEAIALQFLTFVITEKLWYSNNAVNFYIYALFGTRFRSELKTMCKFWCCNRKQKKYYVLHREMRGTMEKIAELGFLGPTTAAGGRVEPQKVEEEMGLNMPDEDNAQENAQVVSILKKTNSENGIRTQVHIKFSPILIREFRDIDESPLVSENEV